MNNNDFFFWLNVIANFAQLESYNILLKDFNNYDLMTFLEHQDDLLNTIIQQNQEIINLLKGDTNNAYSENDTENRE